VTDLLLFGDSARNSALRHEVPLAVVDPFLVLVRGDHKIVVTSVLEADRMSEAVPGAEILLFEQHGLDELLGDGVPAEEAVRRSAVAAAVAHGVREAIVPPEFPLGVAELLRAQGVTLRVDEAAVTARRRAKSEQELAGVRNAQAAAHHGMEAARQLLRDATGRDGVLHRGPAVLTSEDVRERVRASCAAHGAPAPPDIIVGTGDDIGHEPGSGPLPADHPIVVDLWPRDEASGCWADMTRTFVVGTPSDEVVRRYAVALESFEAAVALVRAGVTGRELFDASCEPIERAGFPTQRTKAPGERLDRGYFWSLGHGVGLDVHEEPSLGRSGHQPLVAGDVIALEPGIAEPGVGEVRVEDLLLVTEDGYERLTDFPYDLQP
jgi:Xaa-Pro aminopeptidase